MLVTLVATDRVESWPSKMMARDRAETLAMMARKLEGVGDLHAGRSFVACLLVFVCIRN